MTPERWGRIKEVFQSALELDEAECSTFLDENCGSDDGLRRQVELLLEEHRTATKTRSPMASQDLSGRTLSHYRILEKLGEGGMGVVYKAQDTKLHRLVALKFLRPEATRSQEWRSRFLQEAEAAAALDHPNICTVYEIDEADGQTFLAMAHVDGESLSERIRKRPLPLEEALSIAIQVTEGLRAAHQKGIVHRDVKSANIMIGREGRAQIMDFGLAHLAGATSITKSGTILGTPAYMSPEQVRGEEVDHRTDIWSLGVVLYEMITGRLPFRGESAQSVALAVQNEDPEPLTALRSGLPLELERIVAKALVKNVGQRYQHVEDLLVDLRSLKWRLESAPVRPSAHPKRAVRANWFWAGAAVVAALILVVLLSPWSPLTSAPEANLMPTPLTAYPGNEFAPSFSPDGAEVVFSWNGEDQSNYDIYRKLIGPGPPLRLTTDPAAETWPAWSPDGQQIAFNRNLGGKWGVFIIPSLGGRELQLGERLWQRGLAWSPDGQWLAFIDQASEDQPSAIYLLSVSTREKRQLTFPRREFLSGDEDPAFSPDGRSLVFVRWSHQATDVYLLALSRQLAPEGEPRRLTFLDTRKYHPTWTPDGKEIIIASGPGTFDADQRLSRFSVSRPQEVKPLAFTGAGRSIRGLAISGKGNRLVYSQSETKADIWRIEIPAEEEPATETRFIASTWIEHQVRWSPDGERIAFLSERSGYPEIWVCDRTGSNEIQVTSLRGKHVGWPTWSPDAQSVAFDSTVTGQGEITTDIHVVNVNGGAPHRITTHPADDSCPSWSGDGKWIYFDSNRTGERQVWKIPATGGHAEQVTRGGGYVPFESPDGRFLFYTKGRDWFGSLWRAPVEGGEERQLLDSIQKYSWEVAKRGIYFRHRYSTTIEFLDFATGKTEPVAHLEKPIQALSVAPDEKSILVTHLESTGGDLMLVENFR